MAKLLSVLLFAMLVLGSIAAEQARQRYPARRRVEFDDGYDQEEEEELMDEEEEGMEEPSLIQKNAASVRTAVTQEADMMQSLMTLMKQGAAQDQKLAAELNQEAAQSAALQADLQAKKAQLERHQAMLKRLEQCLNAPQPPVMVEESAKSEKKAEKKVDADGTCDCFAMRQQLADARMQLENAKGDQTAYKSQFEKAKKQLKTTTAQLNRLQDQANQPTMKTGCDALADCRSCIANPACGWCSSSNGAAGVPEGQGMCRRHDVTARLRGFPNQDGLTSGECSAKNWQTTVNSRITALSLNVFAADINRAKARARAIFDLVEKTKPTFIAFQGVEDWFMQALKLESWSHNYKTTDFGSGHAAGGLHILSKFPITKFQYFESTAVGQVHFDMRPRVLVAQVSVESTNGADASPLTIAATNFDYRSADNRADSLDFVNGVLSQYEDVLVMGTVNFDQGSQPETDHIPKTWLDVWSALEPSKRGYTWNPEYNLYARASDPTAKASRIDRVFVKSPHWLPRRIRLVGCSSTDLLCQSTFNTVKKLPDQPSVYNTAPAPKPQTAAGKGTSFLELQQEADNNVVVFPSNHYGLFVHLSHFQPRC